MSVDIFSKNKETGKRIKKTDALGNVMSTERIIPKGRPRFSMKTRHTYTPESTHDFEHWIRRKFFDAYPGNCGVYYKKAPFPVHSLYLGCRKIAEDRPCLRYRQGSDFLDCQVCLHRRKNLCLFLDIFLKDDRHLDLDNVVKIVLDAMNKVCFYDDGQFVVKDVCLYPFAEQEHLDVSFMSKPVQFVGGSLVGGYAIYRLPIKEAAEYVQAVAATVEAKEFDLFLAYLRRCDHRKYVEQLIPTLKPKGI